MSGDLCKVWVINSPAGITHEAIGAELTCYASREEMRRLTFDTTKGLGFDWETKSWFRYVTKVDEPPRVRIATEEETNEKFLP